MNAALHSSPSPSMANNGSYPSKPTWDVELCKSWIAKCHAKEHHVCNWDVTRKSDIFPSRLIYVGTEGEDPKTPRLHPLSNNEKPSYITLSHCWGGAQVYTLNPETKHEMIKAVPMEKLAKNFQDAIHVTRELGYSYIWIDSLCIIQNQQRKPEWEAESAKDWTEQSRIMGDVYRNSDLTIAATSAANPHVGFINLKGHPNDTNTSQNGVEDSPLCQRAWVFQERLLSPRMLHFTNSMLFWECRTMTASEIDPSGHPRDRRVNERMSGTRYPTTTEAIAFEQDLETKLNLSHNPCSLGHDLYRDSQRRFLHPHMWHAADRNYAEHFSLFGGGVRRLRDMGSRFRNTAFGGSSSRWLREDVVYPGGVDSLQLFVNPRLEPVTNDSDMGWDGFRGSFAALSGQSWSPQVGEPIAPEKNKEDAFLFHRRWYDLVKVYSAGKLTFQKDKLMAISSIVREIQERHPANGYVDGLWEETLLMDLLWRVDVKGDALAMGRLKENELPSWTWASTDCRVTDGLESDESWAEVGNKAIVVEVTPSSAIGGSRHGRSVGVLKMRGVLVKCIADEVGGRYVLKNEDGEESGEMYPDFRLDPSQGWADCMSILEVDGVVKGLVLSVVSDDCGEIVYSRCGYFSRHSEKGSRLVMSPAAKEVSMVDVTII